MKVLMINVVCGIRSTGRICTDLAKALEEQGHEVKIAYGREGVPKQMQKYAVKIGTDFDIKMHGLKARLFDASGFSSRTVTTKFIKWVKEYDPDIIHLHNIHGYYINVEVLFDYLKTCKKKIIWTLHDCWAFTGHAAYCDAVNCERWKSGCFDCPQISEYPKTIIDKSKRNWENKKNIFTNIPNLIIVTPSQWLANLVKESFLKEYRVHVIHNGVDTSQFKPLPNDFKEYYGIQNKTLVLGDAAEWYGYVGISNYSKLAELLGNKYQVVLFGITDDQKEKIPANVLGLTKTKSVKEATEIFCAADFVLKLSKVENYQDVNFETIDYASQVIKCDIRNSKVMENIVVFSKNIQEIADAIKKNNNLGHSVSKKDQTTTSSSNTLDMQKGWGYWRTKAKFGVMGKKVILGAAAIWDNRKGLNDLITLSQNLTDEYKIIIVGLTDKQLNKLPNSIIGFTRTNSIKDLVELYSIADIFVNPTIEDNYPTTNLEAIACDTPVITYDTGGSSESANIFGQTISKGNIEELIEIVKTSKKFLKTKEYIGYKEMIKKYLEMYNFEE